MKAKGSPKGSDWFTGFRLKKKKKTEQRNALWIGKRKARALSVSCWATLPPPVVLCDCSFLFPLLRFVVGLLQKFQNFSSWLAVKLFQLCTKQISYLIYLAKNFYGSIFFLMIQCFGREFSHQWHCCYFCARAKRSSLLLTLMLTRCWTSPLHTRQLVSHSQFHTIHKTL